ncbi:hypothetical protein B1L04_00330 [Microcystis aeruginosa KW]|uniref:Uncharacterized protein n=1 Tax=Microcystis aeruginosa KW TaxID=1960155 RepID=A0A1V4BZS9_MICAE|nr:hypothetical protein B1L04_00305 [Microcystis aeruginosa KW]OPF20344.1 hypothetical protein B1L04_00330 [Microcystis aeruginosa KW]
MISCIIHLINLNQAIRLSKIEQNIVNSRKARQKRRSHDINCKGLLLTVLAQQSPIFQGGYNKNLQKTGFFEKPVF